MYIYIYIYICVCVCVCVCVCATYIKATFVNVFSENISFILIKFNSVFTFYFREVKDVQDTEKVHKIVSIRSA